MTLFLDCKMSNSTNEEFCDKFKRYMKEKKFADDILIHNNSIIA